MKIITPGTLVGNLQAERWNRTVLIARPRIASGAVDSLSESIRRQVSKFSLTILATVTSPPTEVAEKSSESPIKSRYKLLEVGVGYSAEIGSRTVMVTSDSAGKQGLSLDFIESRMLTENEKQIAQLQTLVQTSTLTIFDAPAIVLMDKRHHDALVRHVIWVDPASGNVSTLVWLLAAERGQLTVVQSQTARLVAESTLEDRAIHIDGNEFTLGIPTKRAFAIERLPPGHLLPWTDSLRSSAARPSYNSDQLSMLVTAINDALKTNSTR